jgi:HK97 family phage prohead protease
MSDELLGTRECSRAYAIEDLTIRSDGDGRTVEAYAAAFEIPAEVRDQDGHYNEVLSRGSFSKTISERVLNFGVFYNHARTLAGTPDGNLSVPIGVPVQVDQDERGVFTATRYLDNPLADSILDGIKQRAIRGQSFSGRFVKSTRSRAQRGGLPTIMRSEVAMKEYGPTVFPVYAEAMILGTRSVSSFLGEIAALDPEEVDRLRTMLGLATPLEPAQSTATSSEAGQSDEPTTGHSARRSFQRSHVRAVELGVIKP